MDIRRGLFEKPSLCKTVLKYPIVCINFCGIYDYHQALKLPPDNLNYFYLKNNLYNVISLDVQVALNYSGLKLYRLPF